MTEHHDGEGQTPDAESPGQTPTAADATAAGGAAALPPVPHDPLYEDGWKPGSPAGIRGLLSRLRR